MEIPSQVRDLLSMGLRLERILVQYLQLLSYRNQTLSIIYIIGPGSLSGVCDCVHGVRNAGNKLGRKSQPS